MMSVSSINSEPRLPPDSPGSSVSSKLMDEYNELLKYAVVVPTYDPSMLTRAMYDFRTTHLPGLATATDLGEGDRGRQQVAAGANGASRTATGTSAIPLHTSQQQQHEDDDKTLPSSDGAEEEEEDEGGVEGATDSRPGPMFLSGEIPALGTRFFGQTAGAVGDSRESLDYAGHESVSDVEYTSGIDQDLARMDSLMTMWTGELKKNVMNEFSQAKIRLLEQHRQQMLRSGEKHIGERTRLQNDIESLKELLHTYEESIERKDQVINNLTQGLQQQKAKHEMLRTFCEWKIRHNDVKRESFASNLARKHRERVLKAKCWESWRSVIETRWKNRVEKACQGKAQEVCMSLTNDYETKIASLNEALDGARREVQRLHAERDRYEETMKKAFMRGVCALNLEAMGMFQQSATAAYDPASTAPGSRSDGEGEYVTDAAPSRPVTVAQEAVYGAEFADTFMPGGRPQQAQSAAAQAKASLAPSKIRPNTKGRVVSAKISAQGDGIAMKSAIGGGGTLAPPMSSVVVEKHLPITKQTVGQATAARYPATSDQSSAIVHRHIAGQIGHVPLVMPNIQTLKVVE